MRVRTINSDKERERQRQGETETEGERKRGRGKKIVRESSQDTERGERAGERDRD